MIKRGDFVKCTRDIYAITNRDTICLVINDSDSWDALPPNRIAVMVVEDYRSNRSYKAIGNIYTVRKEYFEKIDYVDEQKRNRERTHKLIMKLANNNMPISSKKITHYASERQLTSCFPNETRNVLFLTYVEDYILKAYEIRLNTITDEAEYICFHEISCFDIEGTFDIDSGIITIAQLLRKNEKKVKTTKLFEKENV